MKIKFLFFLLLLPSCKTGDYDLFEFDPRDLTENPITLADIADDIYYIPLDNSYPLGLIYDNIEIIDDSIFLSVKDIGILVLSMEGKILRTIGTIGRGPGEYIYNFNFAVDNKTETIYIADIGNIIKVFSRSGEFQRSFDLKGFGSVNSIRLLDSNLLAFFSLQNENYKYKWVAIDSLGQIIESQERKFPAFVTNFGGGNGTYKFQDKIFYWNSFLDTVFEVSTDLVEVPSFIISPGDHRWPKSGNIGNGGITKYLSVLQILETNHYWMIRCIYKGKNDFVIVEKKNRESYLTAWEFNGRGGISNNLDGGTSFLPRSYFEKNNIEFLVGFVQPAWLKTKVNSNEFKKSNPKSLTREKELEKLVGTLTETDNPILTIVRLRK